VNQPLALSYGQQLTGLADAMATQWKWPSPESSFTLYAFQAARIELPFDVASTTFSDSHRRRLVEAPVLAAAGYMLAECAADLELQAEWVAGLGRLTTRQAFPRDRESFFYRPLELLGICLGVRTSNAVPPDHRQWLVDVIKQSTDHTTEADAWTQLMRAQAAQALGVSWRLPQLPRPQECGVEELALLVWLHLTNLVPLDALELGGRERENAEMLLLRTALAPLPKLDASRAAILYISLIVTIERIISSSTERYWQFGRDSRDAVELVRTLCSRFHLFALQVQKRHGSRPTISFEDEYDVQDALHALLRLHFDDVRSEEWTPSYAGNASRTDFLLKREQVVVETKITRTRSRMLDQKEITNQLIIDARRYQTHPDCKTLVCFVYDPSHVCDNVAALESDVSSAGPPLRVVVVVAPTGT